MTKDELDFLRESNNIENEWDDLALQDAILAWQFIKGKKTLTVANVLKTHLLLMVNRDTISNHEKGFYRKCDIWVGGREGLSWPLIPVKMGEWIFSMNNTIFPSNIGPDLEEYVKQCHIQYEHLHPFADGNGRTGRMFMNWQRLKLGLPITIIEEKKKQEYYKWF